jgi:hypothetical protein
MMAGLASSLACAVCYGASNDPMVKGAAAGVKVLGGFIFFVLVVIGYVGVRLGLRSRVLALQAQRRGAERPAE